MKKNEKRNPETINPTPAETTAEKAAVAPVRNPLTAPEHAPVSNEHGPVETITPAVAHAETPAEKDLTTPAGDGAPLPAETTRALTAAEKAAAEKAAARKAARENVVTAYAGNIPGFLAARRVEFVRARRDGTAVYSIRDFEYGWMDENSTPCTAYGKIPVTAFLTKPARDNFAACMAEIYRTAAAAGGVFNDDTTAPARAAVTRIMELFGLPVEKRKTIRDDTRRIVASAYGVNPDGNDDSNPAIAAVEATARRVAVGRAANNAYAARMEKAAAEKAKKAAETAPALPGTIIK